MTQLTKTPPAGQFSLRSLFVAMTLAAVFFAIVGPTVGKSSPENRVSVFVFWGGAAAGFLVILLLQGLERRTAVRRAGQIHFCLPNASARRIGFFETCPRYLAYLGTAMYGLLVFCAMVWLTLVSASLGGPPHLSNFVGSVLFGALIGSGAPIVLGSSGRIELGENGLVQGQSFIPWNRVTEYQWPASHANRLVFKTGSTARRATVSEDQIPAVNDFLARYAQREES